MCEKTRSVTQGETFSSRRSCGAFPAERLDNSSGRTEVAVVVVIVVVVVVVASATDVDFVRQNGTCSFPVEHSTMHVDGAAD